MPFRKVMHTSLNSRVLDDYGTVECGFKEHHRIILALVKKEQVAELLRYHMEGQMTFRENLSSHQYQYTRI